MKLSSVGLLAALAAPLFLNGCGVTLRTAEQTTTDTVRYRAYGDSITYGSTLADPSTEAYPSLVAKTEQVTFVNRGAPGDEACDVPRGEIFKYADSPTLASRPTYSLLIGTNDVDHKGTGAYEAVFLLCHQASISWMGLPLEDKVLATDPRVTTTGGGSLDTTDHWNSWTTAGPGSSVSFPITTTGQGPIYAWPRIDDNNPGTYNYLLDGVMLGSGSTQTTPRISTFNHTINSLGFLRIPAVPPGPHVVTFIQTSPAAKGLSVVGVGAPLASSLGRRPTVLLGTVPPQRKGDTGFACGPSDAPCEEYTQDIEADAALFAGDGLDVRLFDTHKYLSGTMADMSDALHPNVLGHMELSHAVESVY